MTQPELLFDLPASRPRKRGQVTRTSVEAGRAVNRDGRIEDVLQSMERCARVWIEPLTSAELSGWMFGHPASTDDKLYVRRGLSDALARGFVEHAGERRCAVSRKKCVTWKLRTR